MAIDKVSITGIEAFGFHGVFEHERKEGQEFIVDVEFEYDTSKAIQTDFIEDAIDYGAIAILIKSIVEGEPKNLIEKVAEEIARQILNNFKVNSVKVTLHKPQAPLDMEFKDVSVSVERRK